MSAWSGLLKKEFHLSRARYLIGLIVVALIFGFGYVTSIRIDEPGVMIGFSAMVIAFHLFYLPLHVFTSLNMEGKNLQLWLHNPQSGKELLSAKLVVSTIAMMVSLAISVTIAFILLNLTVFKEQSISDLLAQINLDVSFIFAAGSLTLSHLIAFSIQLTVWIMFLWTAFQLCKSRIGRWSWLVLVGLIFIPTAILTEFQETPFFAWITNWGKINITFLEELHWNVGESGMFDVYIGDYVFHLLITAGLFFLSAWLIDKKVEV